MRIQPRQTNRGGAHLAKGFSLFEMVIVMGIIGLILGGAIYTMGNIKDGAAISTADTDMKAFVTALEQYRNIGGTYPSQSQGLEALYRRPTDDPRPKRWTKSIDSEDALLDPWNTKYKYQFPGSKDERKPEIISAGPDGKFSTEDDLSSQDGTD